MCPDNNSPIYNEVQRKIIRSLSLPLLDDYHSTNELPKDIRKVQSFLADTSIKRNLLSLKKSLRFS